MEKSKEFKKKVFALIAITLTSIFWGYSFISTKILLAELPPISIAFFRQVIASIVMVVIMLFSKSFKKMTKRDLILLAIASFFGVVLYFVFENIGLKYTTASNASIIVAAVPIFTLVTESIFYKLKITVKLIICVALSVAGVFMVILEQGSLDLSSSTLKGNILMLLAMMAWVVYTIISKGLTSRYTGLLLTTYQMIVSSILFIPFIIHEVPKWHTISTSAMLNLLYLSVFCSALAYYLYNLAVKELGATVTTMFLNLIPVVTIIGGILVLDESISGLQIGGMMIIILSLFIVNSKKNKAQ